MTIGYRPKGESGPAYHPERDLAYITPTLMASAISNMEADDMPIDVKNWKKDNNITADEINEAATALARAQRDFVNAADPVRTFEQALNRRDFSDIRYPVRQFLFATIGHTICAAWFTAVREVSRVNEESPAATGLSDFLAAVKTFAGSKYESDNLQQKIAQLQLKNDVLQARLNTIYAEYIALKSASDAVVKNEPKSTPRYLPQIPKNLPALLNSVIKFLTGK
jgi:hypothetical protein